MKKHQTFGKGHAEGVDRGNPQNEHSDPPAPIKRKGDGTKEAKAAEEKDGEEGEPCEGCP